MAQEPRLAQNGSRKPREGRGKPKEAQGRPREAFSVKGICAAPPGVQGYSGLIGSLNSCQRGALLSTPRPAMLRPGRFCGVSTSPNTTKSRGGAALPDLTVAAAANPTGSHARVGLASLGFRV